TWLLERIGDKEVAANGLNTERRETRTAEGRGWELRVDKGTGEVNLVEMLVEDVDGARVEIGGEQEVTLGVAAESQSFIDRTGSRLIGSENGVVGTDLRVPAGERAVLGGENKGARSRLAMRLDDEIGGGVEDVAGWSCGSPRRTVRGRRDRDYLREGHAGAGIKRGETGA